MTLPKKYLVGSGAGRGFQDPCQGRKNPIPLERSCGGERYCLPHPKSTLEIVDSRGARLAAAGSG